MSVEKLSAFGDVNSVDDKKVVPAFGIDLGTTNSAIALVSVGNAAKTIKLESGKTTMPSCIMWKGVPGEFIVGEEAYANRYLPNTVYSIKRHMCEPDYVQEIEYEGKKITMTPAEVSAEILKGLVKKVGNTYGEIKDVVVTVPAYFRQEGLMATKKACELAGLNLLRLFKEPTAAALNYKLDASDTSKSAIVYDLGGGTFDVSIVNITAKRDDSEAADLYGFGDDSNSNDDADSVITVAAVDGNSKLGGDDYDRELYKIFKGKLLNEGVPEDAITKEDEEKMILHLEKLKKDTVKATYIIPYSYADGKYSGKIEFTPVDFARGFAPVYEKTRRLVNKAIRSSSVKPNTIVLVGGSTKNPILLEYLKRDYPTMTINNGLNPDESVANGAAISAKRIKFGTGAVQIFDVVPIAIGIHDKDRVKHVIEKNAQLPVTNSVCFTTTKDNQKSLTVTILQGNSTIPEECDVLCNLLIDGIKPAPAGEPDLSITLSINVDGILKCTAKIDDITKEIEISINGKSNTKSVSKEEKMIKRWRNFAEQLGETEKNELLNMIDMYPDKVAKSLIVSYIQMHRKVFDDVK